MPDPIYQGSCTFYDGTSAKALEGMAEISTDQVYFKENLLSASKNRENQQAVISPLEINLPISSIHEVVEQNGTVRILFSESKQNSSHQTLILPVTGLLKQLHQARQLAHTGSFKGFLLWVKGCSWQTKIALAMGLAALNISVYFLILFQSYRVVPLSFDLFLGRNVAQRVYPELQCKNKKLEARLQKIVQKLTPDDSAFAYQIYFVDHAMPNAFAIPGGGIILFSGMLQLAGSEEEIAGVLAHEIAHVEKRHSVQNLVRAMGAHYLITMVIGAGFEELETLETIAELGSTALFLKYSREFEAEADKIAIQYLHQHQVSLQGFQDFFKKLPGFAEEEETEIKEDSETGKTATARAPKEQQDPKEEGYTEKFFEWVSTHPLTSKRVAWLEDKIKAEKFKPQRILPKEAKWKRISQVCPKNENRSVNQEPSKTDQARG